MQNLPIINSIAEEILLLHRRERPCVFLFTSALGNEGVTTISRHIARRVSRIHGDDVYFLEFPKSDLSDESQTSVEAETIEMIKSLRKEYSIIIIDAGGLLEDPRAFLFLDNCDCSILVARAGYTPRQSITDAIEKIKRYNSRFLGVVLNRTRNPIPRVIERFLKKGGAQ